MAGFSLRRRKFAPSGVALEASHEAAGAGLVAGFMFGPGSNSLIDLCGNQWIELYRHAHAVNPLTGKPALVCTFVADQMRLPSGLRLLSRTAGSVAISSRITGYAGFYPRRLQTQDDSRFRLARAAADNLVTVHLFGSNVDIPTTAPYYTTGQSVMGLSWDASHPTIKRGLYREGVLVGSSSTAPGSDTEDRYIQLDGGAGEVDWMFFFDRAVDQQALFDDPMALVRARRQVLYFDTGGGGGTTTHNLSGSAVSALASTLSAEIDVAINGVSVTTSTGTLSPAIEVTSSGSAVSVLSGSISPSLEVALSGESVATSAGTVSSGSDTVLALSGSQATSSVGPLSIAVDVALSGQSVSAETGIVGSGSDTTQALSGSSVATQSGTLAQDTDLALSGSVVGVSAGIISGIEGVERTLTGAAVTSNAGNVSESIEIALTGQNVTTESGFIGAGADVTKALTGSQVTVAQQTLYSDIAVTAVGAASTVVVGSIFGNSEVGLLGIELTPTLGAFVPNITCSINGSQAITYTGILTGYDVLNIVRNVVARNAYVSSKVSKTSILSFKVSKGVQV